jgi:hypothetical protein
VLDSVALLKQKCIFWHPFKAAQLELHSYISPKQHQKIIGKEKTYTVFTVEGGLTVILRKMVIGH